jgi:hypothetical protein
MLADQCVGLVDDCLAALERLEARLAPVLSPRPPSSHESNAKVPNDSATPLGSSLRAQRDRLQYLAVRIADILPAIEV